MSTATTETKKASPAPELAPESWTGLTLGG